MAKQTATAVSKIQSLLKNSRVPKRWHERVAPEHADTLREILDAWRAGQLGQAKKTAAASIAKYLNENNISSVGQQGVIRWLDEAA